MKRLIVTSILAIVTFPAMAAKPCDELKAEIAAKLDAKGVKDYSLEIVPAADVGEKKIVGSCEAGTKKIVYVRK